MSEQLRNKLKDPLFITLLVLGVLTLIALVLFGGWFLKSVGGLFGFGAAASARKTLRKWNDADKERRVRLQAKLEWDRKQRDKLRNKFHDQAKAQAAREAQIDRDQNKTADEQREALLRDAKKIDDIQ